MKKNDIITLEITGITGEGHGIGRITNNSEKSGFVVFVPFSAVGDTLKVRLLKIKTAYGYGKIEEIITPSPFRITAECPLFQKCGGCDYAHISYHEECRIKEQAVKDAFTRLGGTNPEFLPMVPAENPRRYRNKAQYPIRRTAAGTAFYGFYRSHSHDAVAQNDCLLQPEVFAAIMNYILVFVNKNRISVYNEQEHKGVLRHVLLRRGHYSGEILVTLIARRSIPEFKTLGNALRNAFPEIKGVTVNINKAKTNVIQDFDSADLLICGTPFITDTMCKNKISLNSKTFYQINTPAAEALYHTAAEFAEPDDKVVFDLYCGVGTIGLSMADKAKKVCGVEIIGESAESAVLNAKANNIANTRFISADVIEGISQLTQEGIKPDVIILDPARKGCEERLLQKAAELSPERIVMISCNPSTAARDCRFLSELGYSVDKVRPFDLFPRTRHVECVVQLTVDTLLNH